MAKNDILAVDEILECNEETREYGLVLTRDQAKEIAEARTESLKYYGRIEVGAGIIGKIINVFKSSPYIDQQNYESTVETLVDIFYNYKNETSDLLADDLIIDYMKEHFDGDCGGSLEALGESELNRLVTLLHGGYSDEDEDGEENDDE